jgi:hypothetical protein
MERERVSVWVLESRENERLPWFPITGSSTIDKSRAERLAADLQPASSMEYRVSEYRRVEPADAQ